MVITYLKDIYFPASFTYETLRLERIIDHHILGRSMMNQDRLSSCSKACILAKGNRIAHHCHLSAGRRTTLSSNKKSKYRAQAVVIHKDWAIITNLFLYFADPHSRVCLTTPDQEDDPLSSYINANYIRVSRAGDCEGF